MPEEPNQAQKIATPTQGQEPQGAFEPSWEELRRLGHQAVDRAIDHLANLDDARVITHADPRELETLLREPLPRAGLGMESSMKRVFAEFLPRATLVNHPRFFAYIPGPGSFTGAVGAFLASATNTFVGTWLGGAVMAQLEVQVLDWLREAMHLPASFDQGILTTGGSMANLGALAAARSATQSPAPDLSLRTVYTSIEAHYSVAKAARILGVTADHVRSIPVDSAQCMLVAPLAAAIAADKARGLHPMAVVATAGTTNTGAVDPLPAIADLCAEHDLWLHVDGAYGAAMALLPEGRTMLAGLERADSITLDPHKWFYAPFESGCLLTRRKGALESAFDGDGSYMQDIPRDEVNFFRRGPELTRGNRALRLWMHLRSIGIDAIADAVRRDIELCALGAQLLAEDPRIEILTPPRMSVCSFTVTGGADTGRKLFAALVESGFALLSSTTIDSQFALRFCVVNPRTTPTHVRETVTHVRALLDQVHPG